MEGGQKPGTFPPLSLFLVATAVFLPQLQQSLPCWSELPVRKLHLMGSSRCPSSLRDESGFLHVLIPHCFTLFAPLAF